VALGPFTTYVPPGVYTRTLTEANAANLVAGLRIPVIIGVGQEELEQPDLELVRGSSATLDQQIVSEDVSQRFVVDETNPSSPVLGAVDGTVSKFRVRNFPVVTGEGLGRAANSPRHVSVTVDGNQVAVGSVQGTDGYVTLQVPPQAGADVRCTYFFHRSDTAFIDDVSSQVTTEQAVLTAPATATYTVTLGTTDSFKFTIDGGFETTIVFTAGSYTAAGIKALVDAASVTGLSTSVYTDERGGEHVRFTAAQSIVIGDGGANGVLGFAAGTQTTRNAAFRVFQRPIVDGTDGGITTTDTSKVVVLVNGSQVIPAEVDGTNGLVTLSQPPASGSTVSIQYWANTWQDTFDYLPNTLVTDVIRCGFSAGRNDYIEEQDFVISNPSADVSIIHWGASYVVASTSRTAGSTVFDDTQIIPTLVDDKLYNAECARVSDTTVVPATQSPNQFLLPEVPTLGNGRDTPLGSSVYNAVSNSRIGLNTNRPDLITVYTGRDLRDALGRNPVTVTQVDAVTRTITLKDAVPPDHNAYATFWYSRLSDDTYVFTNKVAGAVNVGQYEVYSTSTASNLYHCQFGTKTGLPETVQWPRGVENIPDAFHTGAGTPVAEIVTVTFSSEGAKNAVYTNEGAAPYSMFAGASDFWRSTLNGSSYVTDLDTAVLGYLAGSRVSVSALDQITITTGTNDEFNVTVDGTDTDVTLPAGDLTPAQIVSAVNIAAGGAVASTGTLTLTGQPLDTETVEIGGKTYTFQTVLTDVDGNVLIGATASDSLDNLIAAINLDAGAGTLYATSMTLHPTVTAAAGAGDTMDVTAKAAGVAGDSITTTQTLTNGTWGGATLSGGVDGTTVAAYYQIGGSGGDVFFVLQSASTPAALPAGFDHASEVSIRQGTAESTLGFSAFQSASGTPTATTKPATLLGTEAGPFVITAGVDDQLDIRVDGVDYQITLTAGAAVASSTIVSDINTVVAGVASVGTLANLDQVRLTSTTFDAGSSVEILSSSTALTVLGFTSGDRASWAQVTAQEVVNGLMATASFTSDAVAYVSQIEGQDYITIESLATGATTSSIVFAAGTTSAFIDGAGTGIVPGTSGDNGENARDIFTVSSSNASGSAGTGAPGQTYTDDVTGLRFTVLESATGSYTATGSFTMTVSPTFKVNPAIPWLSIGGLEVVVTDTVGVGVDDTATVQTFDPSGLEPAIGDFYYITYNFMKQDYSTRLYQQFKTVEANFGPLSAENRVTLASYLAIQNGAVLVGIKQVLKVANTNQASAQSFNAAISDLATPLPGNIRPNVLLPLSTDTSVYSFLMQHCETQSNIRNQSERTGIIGFASGTSPTNAQTIAKSLLSNRISAVYPDSAVVTLTNELGENFEVLVDGTFLAAAVGGAVVSPAVDVATPWTRRLVQGFTRLPRILDPIASNQTAVAGITLLEDLDPIIRIRQGLTTDMSNVLTRLPTVTQIADYVQQQSRTVLDSFVGTKFLSSRTNEVEVSMTALFRQLVQAEIVGAFTGIAGEVSVDDPTVMRVESYYQPIFPLLYILLTFNLRARI